MAQLLFLQEDRFKKDICSLFYHKKRESKGILLWGITWDSKRA